MVNSKTDWVEASQEQLVVEGRGGARSAKISQDLGLEVQPALEPIPDNDWTGETWGLFWPDQELEEKSEDPSKYIKKHYEDNSKKPKPANMKADSHSVEVHDCPRPKLPTPPPPPSPKVVLRKKKTPPPPPTAPVPVRAPVAPAAPVTVFDPPRQDVDNDNSKWSWLRSGDKSAGKARFSLSIYW